MADMMVGGWETIEASSFLFREHLCRKDRQHDEIIVLY